MEKDYVIFSQRLAGFLMFNGCMLKKITKSKKNETKFVYFFNDNESVRNLVNQYQSNQPITISEGKQLK